MPNLPPEVILEALKLMNNIFGGDQSGMGMGDDSDVPPVPEDGGDMFDDEAFGVEDAGPDVADDGHMDGGDEPPSPAHPEPEPDDEAKANYNADCEDGEMARYESSAMAAPSATNTFVPSTVKKEKARMGRSTTDHEAVAEALQAAQAEIAALKAEIGTLARYNRQKNLESRAVELKTSYGIDLDVNEVVEDTIDLDEAKTEKYFERVKSRYTRSPESVATIAADAVEAGRADGEPEWYNTGDEVNAATAYSLKKRPSDGEDYIAHYRRAVAKGDAEAPKPRTPQVGSKSRYR